MINKHIKVSGSTTSDGLEASLKDISSAKSIGITIEQNKEFYGYVIKVLGSQDVTIQQATAIVIMKKNNGT